MNWPRILKKSLLMATCIVGWGMLAVQSVVFMLSVPAIFGLGIYIVVPVGLVDHRHWPVLTLVQLASIACSAIAVHRRLRRAGKNWREQVIVAVLVYPLVIATSNMVFAIVDEFARIGLEHSG